MERSSGILLHPTSLPSPYGIGDFGPEAYRFVDFLKAGDQRVWAVLPLTIPDMTNSPYASPSAMALNWLLVSPDQLIDDELLSPDDRPPQRPVGKAQYGYAYHQKRSLIEQSYEYFQSHATPMQREAFATFTEVERDWLESYALFMTIKALHQQQPWPTWPAALVARQSQALDDIAARYKKHIDRYRYEQWLVHEQWRKLKSYANESGITIFGDLPFFVTHDSVDVWTQPSHYLLDDDNNPTVVAGVPPDYFSTEGQLWDNPHYNWPAMQRDRFSWWIRRLNRASRLYDTVRLDHFRGFVGVWQIPFGARTARHGKWTPVPGRALFNAVMHDGPLPEIVAEDLGTITPDVEKLRTELGLPGMRVLQFAFSGFSDNIHLPQNFTENVVAYTGTHDNDTSRGWFANSSTPDERWYAGERLQADEHTFAEKLMRYGMASPAHLFITPLQDVLNLGSEARMNTPGTTSGNWRWRFSADDISDILAGRLAELTAETKRAS